MATVCQCAPAEAKSNSSVKDSHKTSSKTSSKSDKKSSKKSSKAKKSDNKKTKKASEKKSKKIKIKADDPKAFTKALLYEKQGVEYEIVETKKSPRRATVPENPQQPSPQDSLEQASAPDSVNNEHASGPANEQVSNTKPNEVKKAAPKQPQSRKSGNNGEFFDFSTMLLPITHEALVGSPYGIRSHRLHRGVDVNVIKDEPVVAAYPGIVTMSRYNKGGYGNYVLIKHPNGIETLYAHLSKRLLKVGDEVFPGDIVGLAGNSGRSSAAHLHFEIRYGEVNIDPCTIIDFPHWSLKDGVDQFSMKKATAAHRKIQAKLRGNNYYIVKKGDSQGDVANWFNISIESLCRINNLKPGAPLKAGQKLRGSK
ncbi:M23 family metallopeptidase [Fibrobacter sp.]|uniref:M23 family metallopeptidase n=1 Tax=Fibrobacter sp. TaxID=35828 RepID=UPI00261FD201|nr:M23 family metallopeptidase [Fibrobacter sp.]